MGRGLPSRTQGDLFRKLGEGLQTLTPFLRRREDNFCLRDKWGNLWGRGVKRRPLGNKRLSTSEEGEGSPCLPSAFVMKRS